MSSITEMLQKARAIEGRLLNLSREVATAGADLCADIADRVINRGERGNGGRFTPYSTNKVPAFWYFGRSLNQSGEAKIRAAAKRKEGVSYKDFREANNRPTGFKNFSFSQEMWRGFGVKNVQFSGAIYTLEIGGQNAESQQKIDWMTGQEGVSIISPSKTELERVVRRLENHVING
jgi:hypothetical protein